MAIERKAIRHAAIDVRAFVSGAISAGSEDQGTTNKEKVRLANAKLTATQTPAVFPEYGVQKVAMNASGKSIPPTIIQGRRAPNLVLVLSERRPTTGFTKTSNSLGRKTIKPARPAEIASVSVR
ncbi:hypothetical protein GCM10009096_01880 [Parasphingorhabdus litoris]|uniref:Uncharacterized protein n=1 Tax=Parasphingorhabdus litoris TaxID=394733 RepID=A0ABP3JY24_9SPHN